MAIKRGLGKGMNALLNTTLSNTETDNSINKNKEETSFINISLIETNKNQPRKNFKKEEIEELSESIKQYGILQPLIVKKNNDKYELIAGERRLRAAKKANLKKVPIIIKDYNKQEILEVSIIENIQRSNLNPIEEALAYKQLADNFNFSQEEIAKKVSKNRSTITNSMRLLKLSKYVQNLLIEEKISAGHARVLISLEDEEKQNKFADDIIKFNLSVRDLEKLLSKKDRKTKKIDELDIFFKDYEEKIKEILGTQVHIKRKQKDKGVLEIEYYSSYELERILELFKTIKS